MPQIRPVSELRNNFADLSREIHASGEPVFLTRNGYGDMVVMSMEAYEQLVAHKEIFAKLMEAEVEAAQTSVRYSHDEVFAELRAELDSIVPEDSDA